MVENAQHDSETTFSKFLNDFVTVSDMIVIATMVFLLIGVKTVICCLIHFTPLSASRLLGFLTFNLLAFGLVEVVHSWVLKYLSLFIFGHLVRE